jgi:hypothetical protein
MVYLGLLWVMRQITPRASSHLTYGLVGFFVGHHERSVMCRLVMLVGNVTIFYR